MRNLLRELLSVTSKEQDFQFYFERQSQRRWPVLDTAKIEIKVRNLPPQGAVRNQSEKQIRLFNIK
jgi:hypothetical protein